MTEEITLQRQITRPIPQLGDTAKITFELSLRIMYATWLLLRTAAPFLSYLHALFQVFKTWAERQIDFRSNLSLVCSHYFRFLIITFAIF